MIEIKNIEKEYILEGGQAFKAVDNISLSFPDVQFVSILGPSGCGKTTLLNMIGGLDSITSGDVIFNNHSIRKMKGSAIDSYRNNNIGFVFQNYLMIPTLNILENVKLALTVSGMNEKEAAKLSFSALEEVGLKGMEKKKPNQLSGGQQQRAAIARAIVSDPSVILADEPTGALDSTNSEEIMRLLKRISEKRLVIMVTHNEELAKVYSQRIIRLQDGKLFSDELIQNPDSSLVHSPKEEKPSKFSIATSLKLALSSIRSKKWKTVLTCIANSFGMIGIAFLLSLNYGFAEYSQRLSEESASSLPVVVTAYSQNSSTETFNETNASTTYPDTDEIYPTVDTTTTTSYTYNNFSAKYMNYLSSLQDEGIVKECVQSFGSDYSFNLMTKFPESIDGTGSSSYSTVSTSINSYNYYGQTAQLPTNIFHVLYGNMDQYDLLAGKLPESKNDLVLVVNQYNAVSFRILKALGFYNDKDTQDDVKDTSLSTKVKPISFKDIIGDETTPGKEYKVFTNSDFFTQKSEYSVTDALGNERFMTTYYQNNEKNDSFYEKNGITLNISGIIRAKSTSAFSILSPALCYSSELQDELVAENVESGLAHSYLDCVVFNNPNDVENPTSAFIDEIKAILEEYAAGDAVTLPTSSINSVIYKYFTFYYPIEEYGHVSNQTPYQYFTSVNGYLGNARTKGAQLVPSDMFGKDLSDYDTLEFYLNQFLADSVHDVTQAYDDIIGMLGYMNAYSLIQTIVIFPTDLANRAVLLEKLDLFNDNPDSNASFASDSTEKVLYLKENSNSMIEDIGQVISIVSVILIIFAVVSVTVSCAMTALLTSNNVLERRKDIGLMRSLGIRKKDIAINFEIESGIIGLFAGLLGSLFTYLASIPINNMMNYYYPRYHVGNISDFTWVHLLIIVGVSLVVGLVSALIPSLKAANENPVDSLRSE